MSAIRGSRPRTLYALLPYRFSILSAVTAVLTLSASRKTRHKILWLKWPELQVILGWRLNRDQLAFTLGDRSCYGLHPIHSRIACYRTHHPLDPHTCR